MNKIVISAMLASAVAFVGFSAWIFVKPNETDPLCNFAKRAGMKCLTLGSPAIYERGAIVGPEEPDKQGDDPLPLPAEYLLSPGCVLPEANIRFSQFKDDPLRSLALPDLHVTVGRNIFGQATANSQGLGGLKLNIGPSAQTSMRIDLKSDGARFFNIETRPLKDLLASCFIRISCADRVKAGQARIIKQLLVAKNLSFEVQSSEGASYPLYAAVGNGLISAGFGAGDSRNRLEQLAAPGDFAFGAALFAPSEFSDVVVCRRELGFISSSFTSTTVSTVAPHKAGTAPIVKEMRDTDELNTLLFTADDRAWNEGMTRAEVSSAGNAIVTAQAGTVEFVHLLSTIPGNRWISLGPKGEFLEQPAFKNVYASVSALAKTEVTIRVVNRTDSIKTLRMTVTDRQARSLSLPFLLPLYSYLRPFTLTRTNGTSVNMNAVWQANEQDNEFILEPLDPGEVATLTIGYQSSAEADTSQDGGSIRNSVLLAFDLQ